MSAYNKNFKNFGKNNDRKLADNNYILMHICLSK